MTMQTALSDEGMVQRWNMHDTASDSAPFSVYFLIANARLEFSLSHSKDGLVEISNRERIAIFHLHSRALARKGRQPPRCGAAVSQPIVLTLSAPQRQHFDVVQRATPCEESRGA
jgi:hypothetical protein